MAYEIHETSLGGRLGRTLLLDHRQKSGASSIESSESASITAQSVREKIDEGSRTHVNILFLGTIEIATKEGKEVKKLSGWEKKGMADPNPNRKSLHKENICL